MSEAKHTPGPWKAQESGSGMLSSTFITDPRGDIIASMMGPSRDNYDAQLIEAAPDMLAALIAERDWKTDIERARAADMRHAAIAKATGKEVQP